MRAIPQGRLVLPDDERLGPIWDEAAALGIPVLIHVADPVAFFEPLDATNERWEELQGHPDWHFWPPLGARQPLGFPSFDALIDSLDRLLGRHSATTFIGAHVGCAAEDLDRVASMLERHPNYHVDIAARLGELGRQPYTAREFFVSWADRIVFGTDVPGDPATNRIYYRFLETRDESFRTTRRIHRDRDAGGSTDWDCRTTSCARYTRTTRDACWGCDGLQHVVAGPERWTRLDCVPCPDTPTAARPSSRAS